MRATQHVAVVAFVRYAPKYPRPPTMPTREDPPAQGGTEVERWTLGNLDVARSDRTSDDGLPGWAKVGIIGLFLALVTPMVGLTGLWVTALLGQLAAEGLEVSRASLPAIPLDTDWDLRAVYVLALVILGMRAFVSRLPRPKWTVAGLGPWRWWFLIGTGFWLASGAALVFERNVIDIADDVHLVVLGGTWLWTTVTAMWLIASAGHAGVVALALASRRSRAVRGMVTTGGLASMAIAAPVLANPEALESDDVYRDAPLAAAALSDLDEAGRELRGTMAGGGVGAGSSSTTTAGARSGSRYTTNECMEDLVKPRGSNQRSKAGKVIEQLQAKFPRLSSDVDDVVYWKLIDICLDEPLRGETDLAALLFVASRNGMSDFSGRDATKTKWEATLRSYRARCLIDGSDEIEESFEDRQHRMLTVADALGSLPSDERSLLDEHYLQQRPFAEMARSHGTTTGAITKATNRVVLKLRGDLKRHCH